MPGAPASKIRIVCISDTHGHANGEGFKLPPGDVLIHAGDLTNQGSLAELEKAAEWLSQTEFDVKIVIAGNHDLGLDANYAIKHEDGWKVMPSQSEACQQLIRSVPGVVYLEHESCTVRVKNRTLRVFGSPHSMDGGKQNWAFQYKSDDADSIWSSIPVDTDILITHTPPAGILDTSSHWIDGGCPALLRSMRQVKPLLHIFGHHHEGRGACTMTNDDGTITSWTDPGAGNRKQSLLSFTHVSSEQYKQRLLTTCVNASIMKRSWSRTAQKEFNKPIVIDLSVATLACD